MFAILARRSIVPQAVVRSYASLSCPGGLNAVYNNQGIRYTRDVSRDPKSLNPQKPGDSPKRFMLRRLGHAYEVYPLIALTGVWFVVFCYAVWISFEKVEIWLDRSQKNPPWAWERIRDNYYKMHTLVFDREGVTHQRLAIMEKLQDEMLEAAKKRGTR